MEAPSKNDTSFREFLEKLQKQNNQLLATTLLQLKTEREIAGDDNNKREEQLDQANNNLQGISKSLSGYDIEQLASSNENQIEILKKALEELSLIRKLTEGSLEYDKESAQYRNLSGREFTSDVSGKAVKKGGYVDFETAANRLAGQGKRVKEANVLNLKPTREVINKQRYYHTSNNVSAVEKNTTDVSNKDNTKVIEKNSKIEETKYHRVIKELTSGFKYFMTDGLSEKPGYGMFQTPPKEIEKKEREQKISSDRQKIESPTNPESDNVTTSQEVIADTSKQDLELSKQLLETTKEQLKTLQQIRDSLVPKTPAELPSNQAPIQAKEEEKEDKRSLVGDLASGAMDLLGNKRGAGRQTGKAASLGSKLARFAGSTGGKALGAAAAVGMGAYTAYQGYTGAEEEKQSELQVIDAKIKAGEITPEQGDQLKKEAAAKATENKGVL